MREDLIDASQGKCYIPSQTLNRKACEMSWQIIHSAFLSQLLWDVRSARRRGCVWRDSYRGFSHENPQKCESVKMTVKGSDLWVFSLAEHQMLLLTSCGIYKQLLEGWGDMLTKFVFWPFGYQQPNQQTSLWWSQSVKASWSTCTSPPA